MKRLFVLAIALLLISALTFTSVLAARDPFLGAWVSTDVDGSFQTLTIGGGPDNTYMVRYYDFGASGCGLDPETNEILYTASAQGFLPSSGEILEGLMPVYCNTHPPTYINDLYFYFAYDASTDTITDFSGIVWNRR